jgi:hypothetical protein
MSLKRENRSDLSDIEKKSKIGHLDLRKRKGRTPKEFKGRPTFLFPFAP